MAADQADSIDTEAVAQAVLEELDTGTVVGDKVVVSRRGLLALAGTSLGAGALATLGVGTAAAADGTQDTSTGDVTGNNGGGVDVYLDELRDPGGDEVFDVDDTGAINAAVSGREWLFDSVSTDELNLNPITTITDEITLSDDSSTELTDFAESQLVWVAGETGIEGGHAVFLATFTRIDLAAQRDVTTLSNTVLNGTTGPDGSLNLSMARTDLQIENRIGSERDYIITRFKGF